MKVIEGRKKGRIVLVLLASVVDVVEITMLLWEDLNLLLFFRVLSQGTKGAELQPAQRLRIYRGAASEKKPLGLPDEVTSV